MSSFSLVDPQATAETVALRRHLGQLAQDHILFGHQHATEYGHGWSGDADRSDVKSVTGAHPAVIGLDFMGLSGRFEAEIQQNTELLRQHIIGTYNRGGVVTVAWHMANPVSDTDFNWKEENSVAAVPHIIPGGSHHEKYKTILKTVAELAKTSTGKDGKLVPMIFRPFHEFDGDWFWWGKSHCTREEFIALWQFTVAYLRDELNVNNFLYAFTPDCLFESESEFLDRYPGDEWVDLVGMDNYADFGRDDKYDLEVGLKKLKIVSDYAQKAGKLAAFSETGLESLPNPTWWMKTLLPTLQSEGLKLCYVLVWRNDISSPTHYYAPFPGHPNVADFLEFYNHSFVWFEDDLPPLYL